MFDAQNRFVIENYQKKDPFSSFLPGIAGPLGVPLWCYYNNRGQAVCSFGVDDKDHPILEFCPAHIAYRDNSRTGFRTFVKVNGVYGELFMENCQMHIGQSEVEISCCQQKLEASALYFGVPGERTGALARVLTLRNASDGPVALELLDGLPALVPYGVNQDTLKNMTQLAKAWMQVEDADQAMPYFRLRASMTDSAKVTRVEGGNFCLAWDENGQMLKPIVQPSLVFGQDTSFSCAEAFAAAPLRQLCAAKQVTQNLFPCCFLPRQAVLQPGKTVCICSLYGQVERKDLLVSLARKVDSGWFVRKRQEASRLTSDLCAAVATRTADPVFDGYCAQSYLDNLLRGGAPMRFQHGGIQKPFYLYSRKHGDPEREYNYFSLGREYYAQGNGNFRDVNQNRRCNVLFAPWLEAEDIHTFYDLIQTDGYNPLVLTASTYFLPQDAVGVFLDQVPKDFRAQAFALLSQDFTPGRLAMAAEDWGLEDPTAFTAAVICASSSEPNADFKEGYWCDHWTYNLDLIESYLAVYPERKDELIFDTPRYRWYESQALVNPREKRYCLTENGLRQYHALDERSKGPRTHKWVHDSSGAEVRSTLIEKLLLLCAIKTATLDPAGMGVEMEGGRPGWYDALNGLPGLLGSSVAESCELARMLRFTIDALSARPRSLTLHRQIAALTADVANILLQDLTAYDRWDRLNTRKEAYRAETVRGLCSEQTEISSQALAEALEIMERTVLLGIDRAQAQCGGICPTYFYFEATQIEGVMPKALKPHMLPLFLEGPVRRLKLKASQEEKRAFAQRIRLSGLYDPVLRMYRVNDSLAGVTYEAGRTLAFTPGWLENGSIWLHMEYKYLLELLKSGLYDLFSEGFRDAAVPFLDPAVYGRSPLENVSFLASSVNPDPSIHGRGFVARLSGSTAEFLQIWQLMFFGPNPFYLEDGRLCLRFTPLVPDYLMPADGVVQATFLGGVSVTYKAPGCSALIPGQNVAQHWRLHFQNDRIEEAEGPALSGPWAQAVRSGDVRSIEVLMK